MSIDVYNKRILLNFTKHQILSKSSITHLKCANISSKTQSYRFDQVVVRNLGKQVMNHVGTNVMMDVVDPTKISVNCGQTSSHVIPFLFQHTNTNICETLSYLHCRSTFAKHNQKKKSQCTEWYNKQKDEYYYRPSVPWHLLVITMVMQVSDHVKPNNINLQQYNQLISPCNSNLHLSAPICRASEKQAKNQPPLTSILTSSKCKPYQSTKFLVFNIWKERKQLEKNKTHPVRNNIELEHPQWANSECKGSQSHQHSYPACC